MADPDARVAAAERVRVAVLVPYREFPGHKRAEQKDAFVDAMPPLLDEAFECGRWAMMFGEQSQDGRLFCRSAVLNALALLAIARYPALERFIFHDIDWIPDRARVMGAYTTPFADGVVALPLHTPGTLVGAFAVQPHVFKQLVNGFCTQLEGWGCGEDAVLKLHLQRACGDGAIGSQLLPGDMRDMDRELGVTLGAARMQVCKLDSKEREMRAKAAADDHVPTPHGAAQLVFSLNGDEACLAPDVYNVPLHVHVTLPPGWYQRVDVATAMPLYYPPYDEASEDVREPASYYLPAGSVVAKAP